MNSCGNCDRLRQQIRLIKAEAESAKKAHLEMIANLTKLVDELLALGSGKKQLTDVGASSNLHALTDTKGRKCE